MSNSNLALKLAAWTARILPRPVIRALYRSPGLAGTLRSTLNRAAPQGLTDTRVAAGGLTGMTLSLDLQSEKDYWLGTYEPEIQQAIQDWVKPGMVAYDVGANIGYTTLLLANAVGEDGRVIAFEAHPANVARLARNLALNALAGRVMVIPAAVVAQPGPVRFLIGPSAGTGKAQGSAGRQEAWYGQGLPVEGISLDNFVFEQGNLSPQAVKMDIEGGEVLALPGMIGVLREIAPLLFLELHGSESAKEAWQILTSRGYKICRMNPGYPPVESIGELDWKAYLVGVPPQAA